MGTVFNIYEFYSRNEKEKKRKKKRKKGGGGAALCGLLARNCTTLSYKIVLHANKTRIVEVHSDSH